MGQLAKGVRAEGYPDLSADFEEILEHLKWNLWHGKVDRALEIVDELAYARDVEGGSPEHRKLLKAVRAFETYVSNHRTFIPNYGERYRQGKVISTAFVESAVNQVVSKRFVKKQQMQWTLVGAHLLLQIRVEVLNGDWRATLSELVGRIERTCRGEGGLVSGFYWSRLHPDLLELHSPKGVLLEALSIVSIKSTL